VSVLYAGPGSGEIPGDLRIDPTFMVDASLNVRFEENFTAFAGVTTLEEVTG
jgi:hypothetical protein